MFFSYRKHNFTEMVKTVMNSESQVTEGVHLEARPLLGSVCKKNPDSLNYWVQDSVSELLALI